MIWEGTNNQMQTPEQDVELTLFAGGDAALAAITAFASGGARQVQEFYDERIGQMYPKYPGERSPEPQSGGIRS